jgi:hypothetical protein
VTESTEALEPKATTPDYETVEERVARGKAIRERVPRRSHARWNAAPDRRDPIDVLEDVAKTRIPELLPIRYGRMSESPFAFFRGSAAVMAADLASTPESGLWTQICGDAHVRSVGVGRQTLGREHRRRRPLRRVLDYGSRRRRCRSNGIVSPGDARVRRHDAARCLVCARRWEADQRSQIRRTRET